MHRLTFLICVALSAFTWTACGSGRSPTAPTAPSDFAAQFDSLWTTFDREYSYFVHKQIDWNALGATYRPRALAATDQVSFIRVIREMLGNLHDGHVVVRDPGGATLPTYSSQAFVNFDRSVWQQYVARANYTPGASDWGYRCARRRSVHFHRWLLNDGQVIEDIGISPQVFVAASAGDFGQGRDPVLDWALAARVR